MKQLSRLALACTFGLMSLQASADVSIKDPWVRATVTEQKATGAFMQLQSSGDARLVEARSPVAGVVEIHEMTMIDNVMKMRAMPQGLDLPAGKSVELKPGSYHVMLIDLKQGLKAGDVVPLSLVVEGKDKKRETLEVKAEVRPLGAAGGPKGPMMQGGGEHKHHH
jgi:copper(I)-binding protein